MADNVGRGEPYGSDALYSFEKLYSAEKSGILPAGKVYLSCISGDDELGAGSHSRKEHLELAEVGVLGFVQNDSGAVQRSAPHVCQRSDLDCPVAHEILKLLGGNHV